MDLGFIDDINNIMANSTDINDTREWVVSSFEEAERNNRRRYNKKDPKATAEYIFENQRVDALNIVEAFYRRNRRVVSVQKRTKVGADGLMLQIIKLMTTHNDDTFVVDIDNVRILTGMSNAGWEQDMKEKAPSCLKENIFHHGKLSKSNLLNLPRNSLIIIDEIDTGDKEEQVLHKILKNAGILDATYMIEHNIRFVIISATIIKQLYDVRDWGELHEGIVMTIPENYIGHGDFLSKGIVQEFYEMNTLEEATRWVKEDILDNYGTDYRVHIVRGNEKTRIPIKEACIANGVECIIHTADERLTDDEIKRLFNEPLLRHVVLIVKGFFRRANLIPNDWKLRIGAVHELCTSVVDNNVQIQGLVGRMTGYWRNTIEEGHTTGPYRTSVNAIKEYEDNYLNPFGRNTYQTSGFKKNRKGVVTTNEPTMISVKNIANLEPTITVPVALDTDNHLEEFETMLDLANRWKSLLIEKGALEDYHPPSSPRRNSNGEFICSMGGQSQKQSTTDIINKFSGLATTTWGAGIGDAESGHYIHRVYVGYTADNQPRFFLRWTKKE